MVITFMADYARRSEVGVEAGEQLQVEKAVGTKCDFALAGKLHRTMRSEVGPLSDEMKLLNI